MAAAGRFGFWSGVFLLAAGLSGCGGGSEQYEVVPVAGIVTCQGKPVANGVVNFTPQGESGREAGRPGRVALGRTDGEGRFKLTTYTNDDGAILGKHVVTVGLDFDESTGRDGSKTFPCGDATKEVTVESGMGEIKIEF